MAKRDIADPRREVTEPLSRTYLAPEDPIYEETTPADRFDGRSGMVDDSYTVTEPAAPPMMMKDPMLSQVEAPTSRLSEGSTPNEPRRSIDDNFTVSEAVGLPLLSENPAPLSSALHVPTLMSEPKEKADAHGALLDKSFSVSEAIGLPMLSDNAAPLSSALHVPTLMSEPDANASEKSSGRANSRYFVSDWLGWPMLLRNPAPFSSALGIPTLIEERPSLRYDEPAPVARLGYDQADRGTESRAMVRSSESRAAPMLFSAGSSSKPLPIELAAGAVIAVMILGPLFLGAISSH